MALKTNRTPSGHSFITGSVVHLRRRFPPRKAAPGPYKVVAQLPERDGQFQYRIKSGCEPFYRTVNETELELEIDAGAALTSASSNELEDRRTPMRGAST
jgi:hypothetical protein